MTVKHGKVGCFHVKWFLKQLELKSQNRHFHTPAVKSLLLQKYAYHITTHFSVEGHIYSKGLNRVQVFFNKPHNDLLKGVQM